MPLTISLSDILNLDANFPALSLPRAEEPPKMLIMVILAVMLVVLIIFLQIYTYFGSIQHLLNFKKKLSVLGDFLVQKPILDTGVSQL